MTAQELAASAKRDSSPPPGISDEARALWHLKKGNWEQSHNIAQDIHTPMGSWIHALIHVIEGDQGNGNYWFAKACKPSRRMSDIDALWDEIATEVCKP
jgi:hypothetical protein